MAAENTSPGHCLRQSGEQAAPESLSAPEIRFHDKIPAAEFGTGLISGVRRIIQGEANDQIIYL